MILLYRKIEGETFMFSEIKECNAFLNILQDYTYNKNYFINLKNISFIYLIVHNCFKNLNNSISNLSIYFCLKKVNIIIK